MDSSSNINPSSPGGSFWDYIMGQKNVSATANNGSTNSSTNPLKDFGAAINLQATSNSTPAGNFNSSPSQPNTTTQSTAPTTTPLSTGDTQNQTTGTTNSIVQQNTSLLSPGSKGSVAGNTPADNQTSGLSGFSGAVSNLGTKALSSLGMSGSITNAINVAGEGLGFGTGVPAAVAGPGGEFIGPAYQGAAGAGSLTSATLSQVLGGAGFGVGIGSLITGFTGGNQTSGMIGGGLGGALGAATGVTSGITMGATLGSVVPGLGTVIGAVAGSILGGLFGPGAPTSAEAGGGSVNANGTVNYAMGGSKNGGAVAGYSQGATSAFSGLLSKATQDLGFQVAPGVLFNSEISTKHPGPGGPAVLSLNDGNGKNVFTQWYTPGDTNSTVSTYFGILSAAAKASGYTDTQALHDWFYGTGTPGQNQLNNATPMIAPKGTYANTGTITA